MKTSLIEIFQVIRAAIQPYATLGFEAKENSESAYRLFTEKKHEDTAGEPGFFAGVTINDAVVELCLFNGEKVFDTLKIGDLQSVNTCFNISTLEDKHVADIESILSEGYKVYKEQGWV